MKRSLKENWIKLLLLILKRHPIIGCASFLALVIGVNGLVALTIGFFALLLAILIPSFLFPFILLSQFVAFCFYEQKRDKEKQKSENGRNGRLAEIKKRGGQLLADNRPNDHT